uniref:Uncharacterized protein n=1 Tax=Solanum tuberosum TaxID=4113 RepID=M1DEL3_SOLTU
MIAGASSSVPVRIDVSTTKGAVRVKDSTTDGVVLVDADTNEGDPSVDLAGSGKSDPPACEANGVGLFWLDGGLDCDQFRIIITLRLSVREKHRSEGSIALVVLR